MINIFYQNVSVNAVMAQTFQPGMTNRNRVVRTKFSICRRDNHALGMTLDRYSVCLALAGTFLMKRICGEIFFLYLNPYYKKTHLILFEAYL